MSLPFLVREKSRRRLRQSGAIAKAHERDRCGAKKGDGGLWRVVDLHENRAIFSFLVKSPLSGLYSELLLASTSSARARLMSALGLAFRTVSSGVDEQVCDDMPAARAVGVLAERKARAVLALHPQALVVGADQLVSLEGRSFGKPRDAEMALAQLRALSGRSHDIFTGLCVVGPGFFANEIDAARLSLFHLSTDELEAYVSTGEWEGCAGGYRIEGRGQALFSRIEGDRTAIQGLPMQRVVRILREARVAFF